MWVMGKGSMGIGVGTVSDTHRLPVPSTIQIQEPVGQVIF